MVVSDLDLLRPGICPDEIQAELVVDPNAVLVDSIALSASSRFPGGTPRDLSETAALS